MSDASGAIRFALSQLGKPYIWGATGPDSYDCSGLMVRAYSTGDNINLPRTTQAMLSDSSLYPVNLGQLMPGDLVFPSTEHVQMYLGGGKVVEAPHSGANVRVTGLGDFYAGRRVTSPAVGDWSLAVEQAGSKNWNLQVPTPDQVNPEAPSSSDWAEGIGKGLTNFFKAIIGFFLKWFVWIFEIVIGFGFIFLGVMFIIRTPVLKLAGQS